MLSDHPTSTCELGNVVYNLGTTDKLRRKIFTIYAFYVRTMLQNIVPITAYNLNRLTWCGQTRQLFRAHRNQEGVIHRFDFAWTELQFRGFSVVLAGYIQQASTH